MNKLTGWIKQHQVIAFFVLCYAISWGLWIPYILLRIELLGLLVLVGVFAPALACVLVSRVIEPAARVDGRKARWIAFVVAWIGATMIFTLHIITPSPSDNMPVVVMMSALVGLVPAFVVSSAFSGIAGVRKSLASLVEPRGGLSWYLVAVLMVPALRLLSVFVSLLFGWGSLSEPVRANGGLELVGLVVVSFLYTLVFAGGLNEETGWTGFALPRLQARHSPLVASVVLWFFWILWHMPLQVAGLWNPSLESLIRALVGTFFARFIFTWLYNRSEGGILTAILLHTSANVAFEFIPVTDVQTVLEAVLAIVVVVSDRMWRKLPADYPATIERRGRLSSAGSAGIRGEARRNE